MSVRYSPVDNILEKTSTLGASSRAHVGEYRYDSPRPHAATQASTLTLDYDNSGNATTIGESTYAWDYRGKMVAATTGPKQVGTLSYDADAIRVQKLEGPSSTWHISPGFEMRDGIATTWVSALGKKMVKLESTELAAKVLPDTFPLSSDGTTSEPDGRITIGDTWVTHARRERLLPNPADSPSAESNTVAEAGTYGQAHESLYGSEGPSLDTMLEAVAKATLIGTAELQTHLHHDALGTTALTTNEAGGLELEALHYPYGEWRHRSTDQLEVYSFTGVERDESTGLSANGARYLHLSLGRFTSPDPLFASLGTVLERSPWEHNLYAYGLGNPVSAADPSGLCIDCPPVGDIPAGPMWDGTPLPVQVTEQHVAAARRDESRRLGSVLIGVIKGMLYFLNSGGGTAHAPQHLEQLEEQHAPSNTEEALGEVIAGGIIAKVGRGIRSPRGPYSGRLMKVNKPDAAADALARRITGQSRVRFANDPKMREFDAISKEFIGQTKPALSSVGSKFRNQAKATFEAAKETGRKAYFHFEGKPAQAVLDKLDEYANRYGVELITDFDPL